MSGKLGGLFIYDRTSWPYTINPAQIKDPEAYPKREILGLRDPNSSNLLTFDCTFYNTPIENERKQKVGGKIEVDIA